LLLLVFDAIIDAVRMTVHAHDNDGKSDAIFYTKQTKFPTLNQLDPSSELSLFRYFVAVSHPPALMTLVFVSFPSKVHLLDRPSEFPCLLHDSIVQQGCLFIYVNSPMSVSDMNHDVKMFNHAKKVTYVRVPVTRSCSWCFRYIEIVLIRWTAGRLLQKRGSRTYCIVLMIIEDRQRSKHELYNIE
jgi:hypothetical protein